MSKEANQAKRKSRRKHVRNTADHGPRKTPPDGPGRLVPLVEYEVTPEAIDTPYPANRAFEVFLGPDRREEMRDLLKDDPAAAIRLLEGFLAEYGPAPLLYNWLASAYSRVGNHEKADEMQRLNYEKFPDYLFARLNHADTLLKQGKVEQAAKVVDHKFDLKLLYPHRSLFHLSEFVAMASLAISYYLETGEMDSAKRMFAVMQELAPDSPATELCGRQILLEQVAQGARRLLRRGRLRGKGHRP